MTEDHKIAAIETTAGRPVRCERCNRLLGTFIEADGEIKCPRCGHYQKILVQRTYNRATGPRFARARL